MITDKENKDDLLKSHVFWSLPTEKLDELARVAQNEVVRQHAIVFKEGEAADNFHIISSDKVRIWVSNGNRVENDLAAPGTGENFADIAILTGESRTAAAEALEEKWLVVLSKNLFDGIVKEYVEISGTFGKEMRSRLLKDQDIIKEEAEPFIKKAPQMSWVDFVLIIAVSIFLALSFNQSNPNGIALFPSAPDRNSIPTISASAVMQDSQQRKVLILDAMPPNFYKERHIKGAVNMPISLFDIVYLMNFSEEDKERDILVYGNSISRPYDMEIATKLMLLGYTNVKIIDGGLPALEANGYPVEKMAAK
jgi:rhodanese-related sulfurtransferase